MILLLHDTGSDEAERQVLVNTEHIDYMRPVISHDRPRTLISFNSIKDGVRGEPKEKCLYVVETIAEIATALKPSKVRRR